MLVENDSFLTELTKMYERNKASGTVWVTLKRSCLRRLPRRGGPRPSPETILDPGGTEWMVLVRATDGKKKISTSVANKGSEKFNKSMTTIQKAYMDGLRETVKKPKKERAAGGSKKKA
uniref:Signal recognition particle 14 kDa protein n=1 Tax=Mantoniella antarctica TaxID=81844 RepID=A0A7S0SFP1_9CHLO|mmetsp:Transcript_8377/g.13176  ORF Transcript_8377/g.13176 Transcript_8377/m.13176 type:complete len:119 (+) Transcript_8377:198-554(+)|eukprot:CAMPEP_0181348530 /NCGR_PEP_ID=MMETSP1106-20121128/225_1 /TAXON_ID=81844 /ORGANISM="Mantoniella antarctica, Strain SL-175" /LENGTH=118 /DNA_ID=CAMNT_0023460829 /DNA_START=180 /DNA_END=536 /DNA_ORIENTATION=-